MHQYLATAWMLRLLGVRVRREMCRLSGAGGRAHELRKKTQPACHVVHVLLMYGQVGGKE